MSHENKSPPPSDQEARRRVIDDLEKWQVVANNPPLADASPLRWKEWIDALCAATDRACDGVRLQYRTVPISADRINEYKELWLDFCSNPGSLPLETLSDAHRRANGDAACLIRFLKETKPANDTGQPFQAVEAQAQRLPLSPIDYLMNWRGILDALKLGNNDENRNRVRQLNKLRAGPIILPGKGGQPKVTKDKLLSWWNSLEKRFEEIEQKATDTQATLSSRHNYARDGQVLPNISGHVKKRRGKKIDE
jgi:hypothetical protein